MCTHNWYVHVCMFTMFTFTALVLWIVKEMLQDSYIISFDWELCKDCQSFCREAHPFLVSGYLFFLNVYVHKTFNTSRTHAPSNTCAHTIHTPIQHWAQTMHTTIYAYMHALSFVADSWLVLLLSALCNFLRRITAEFCYYLSV